MYKAVIFDLDGTLLNTLEDLADSVNVSLERLGYPPRTLEEIRQRVGHGILNLLENSVPESAAANEKIIFRAMHEMGEAYSRRWNQKTRLYEGIAAALDALTLKRVPMGILSNKPHPFTIEMCAFFLKKWDFSFILGGREHLPLKPDPAAAYEGLKMFQQQNPALEAREVLFIGDGDTDVATALAAGMDPLAALWGFRTKAQLAAAGAARFAETPKDILAYFA